MEKINTYVYTVTYKYTIITIGVYECKPTYEYDRLVSRNSSNVVFVALMKTTLYFIALCYNVRVSEYYG